MGSFFLNTDLAYYSFFGALALSSLPFMTLATLKDQLAGSLLRGSFVFDVNTSLVMLSSVVNYLYMLRLFF